MRNKIAWLRGTERDQGKWDLTSECPSFLAELMNHGISEAAEVLLVSRRRGVDDEKVLHVIEHQRWMLSTEGIELAPLNQLDRETSRRC